MGNPRVATYARYSTDLQDQTSIDGQVANCKDVAASNGWDVIAHYSDAAISGSDESRPDYLRLLADSEAMKFDGIIVDETSRLTRSPGELPRLLELIEFRDQFLVDCKGFDSRQQTASLLAAVYGGIDSLEIRKIKARTHRGLRERAKAGFSAGGRAYGYSSVKVDPDDDKTKFRKIINEEQAIVVREIYGLYADGASPLSIAKTLNRRGVPSPGASWKRKGGKTADGKWRVSSIYGDTKRGTGILCNELYRGQYVWNRCEWRKEPGSNKRKPFVRPESEWMRLEMPELRIIDDALWSRVQLRIKETQKRTAAIRAKKGPKAAGGRTSKYLLSGLMTCTECGSNYIMADSHSYQCSANKNGGEHACKNGIRVKRETAESVILEDVQTEMLSDTAIAHLKKELVRLVKAKKRELSKRDNRDAVTKEITEIETQLSNLVDFIAEHGHDDSVKARLDDLGSRRDRLKAEAKVQPLDLDRLPDLIPDALKRFEEKVSQLANIPESAPATKIARLRSLLRDLVNKIPLYPQYDEGILVAGMSLNEKALVLASKDYSALSYNYGSGGRI